VSVPVQTIKFTVKIKNRWLCKGNRAPYANTGAQAGCSSPFLSPYMGEKYHRVCGAAHGRCQVRPTVTFLVAEQLLYCFRGRYSFPNPLRVGGWVGPSGWSHAKTIHLPTVTHPSTNRARRGTTSLIRPTTLPLGQTATHRERRTVPSYPPDNHHSSDVLLDEREPRDEDQEKYFFNQKSKKYILKCNLATKFPDKVITFRKSIYRSAH